MIGKVIATGCILVAGIYVAGVMGKLPNITYSEGQRTGVITKVSKKGYFCKTWEAEMNMGTFGTNRSNQLGTTVFEFSVLDDAIASQIEAKSKTGDIATVNYTQLVFPAPCARDTSYVATSVE